ncbi:MAG TPA: response regulator [Longimicrobiales bacterium]
MPGLSPSPSRAAALVLVADRDPVVRELVEHFLLVAGFHVEFVLDGSSALARAQELRPDVVLTEVMLPRLDGLTLCRRLRSDPATCGVPVVVFSVLAAAERAREAGAAAFLLKPLAERQLVDTIRGVLESPPMIRPEASA